MKIKNILITLLIIAVVVSITLSSIAIIKVDKQRKEIESQEADILELGSYLLDYAEILNDVLDILIDVMELEIQNNEEPESQNNDITNLKSL